MASARHARSKQSRPGVFPLVLVALAALSLAVAAAFVDDPALLRAAVVTAAVLVVVATWLAWSASSNAFEQARGESRSLRRELGDVRRELAQVHDVSAMLAGEVARLRAHLEEYVLPLSSEPEPVYPSLHLPLVRAAFGELAKAPTDASRPVAPPSEVPPAVSADSGSEGRPSRQLVDLTRAPSPERSAERIARGA
ncbi:MAG: hypothetical protein WAN48_04115 [Actinomycetes bacterium]